MLHNVLSTAIALRGQTWLGQTWLSHLAHLPATIGGIFRIFPNSSPSGPVRTGPPRALMCT
jgi:hypothetical protein